MYAVTVQPLDRNINLNITKVKHFNNENDS